MTDQEYLQWLENVQKRNLRRTEHLKRELIFLKKESKDNESLIALLKKSLTRKGDLKNV